MSEFKIEVDLEHGARWNSLRDSAGREWLWSQPEAARSTVCPGDPFIDVGGVEECFPTLTGTPDHGEVWSVAWEGDARNHWVSAGQWRLRRSIDVSDVIVIDYELTGDPFARFLWAFHALLPPDIGTRILLPSEAREVWSWPDGAPQPVISTWPIVRGEYADVLGPDDGTATFSVLPNVGRVHVKQQQSSLIFTLEAQGQPTAIGLWRNLNGYSWKGPSRSYRSFGVEPMIGRGADLAQTSEPHCGQIPASGVVTWRLTIESRSRTNSIV